MRTLARQGRGPEVERHSPGNRNRRSSRPRKHAPPLHIPGATEPDVVVPVARLVVVAARKPQVPGIVVPRTAANDPLFWPHTFFDDTGRRFALLHRPRARPLAAPPASARNRYIAILNFSGYRGVSQVVECNGSSANSSRKAALRVSPAGCIPGPRHFQTPLRNGYPANASRKAAVQFSPGWSGAEPWVGEPTKN